MLLLLAMVLSACNSSGSISGGCEFAGCDFGGTVIDGITQEPSSLLPQRSNQQFAQLVQTAIRSPLFATDDQGGIVPVLATEVPSVANGGISQDGKTLSIHIRSDARWSNGQPLTADDVLYTINLFRDPAYAARDGYQAAAREIRKVSQPDPHTIVITLKNVDAAFLALYFTYALAFAPLPKHVYGSMVASNLVKSDESFKPTVTNGPFKVSERVPGDQITVVRDDNLSPSWPAQGVFGQDHLQGLPRCADGNPCHPEAADGYRLLPANRSIRYAVQN